MFWEFIMLILTGIFVGMVIGVVATVKYITSQYVLRTIEQEVKEEEAKQKVMHFCSVHGYTF